VIRKEEGDETRSKQAVCDVCAAHGERAAVGVNADAQGRSLRKDETHVPLDAKAECCAFLLEIILLVLRWHSEEAVVFPGFSMSL
jgi:hypothetical protein